MTSAAESHIRPNSTWLVTSRLDTTRHVRCRARAFFDCVELVEQHGSIRSSRRARQVERVKTSGICYPGTNTGWPAVYTAHYRTVPILRSDASSAGDQSCDVVLRSDWLPNPLFNKLFTDISITNKSNS